MLVEVRSLRPSWMIPLLYLVVAQLWFPQQRPEKMLMVRVIRMRQARRRVQIQKRLMIR